MLRNAARLVIVLVLAIAPRAASGQQYFPQPPQHPSGQPQQAGFNQPPGRPPLPPPTEVFRPAEIMARVGDRFIFYGDVIPNIDLMLDPALLKAATEEERQEILRKGRALYVRPMLEQMVQSKILYLEFDRQVRRNAKDKYGEARSHIDKSVRKVFDTQLAKYRELVATLTADDISKLLAQNPIIGRLALVMRENKLESLGELDLKLRSVGTSLEQQIVQFGEQALGRDVLSRYYQAKHPVTHEEMLDYYEQHAADFQFAAKARFELLTAKTANYGGDRAAARNAVAAMGNDVFHGVPFAAVAKKGSQEPNAANGGQYDWVTQGSLASKPLDEAVFRLEPGKLSEIIEDDAGFHIVRVVERAPAGSISFVEAQPKIKLAIEQQKAEAERKKFFEQLLKNTEVWTVFDPPGGRETAGQ